jgi:hypothetical protein
MKNAEMSPDLILRGEQKLMALLSRRMDRRAVDQVFEALSSQASVKEILEVSGIRLKRGEAVQLLDRKGLILLGVETKGLNMVGVSAMALRKTFGGPLLYALMMNGDHITPFQFSDNELLRYNSSFQINLGWTA